MLAQFKCLTLVLLFVQVSAFAQKDDKIVPAGANDIVTPVVMKTSNPDEVNVGAFSFTPNDKVDPKAISKLRAELFQMEKNLEAKTKEIDTKTAQLEATDSYMITSLSKEVAREMEIIEAIDAKKIQILEAQRALALQNQYIVFKNAKNQDEKAKAEVAMMNLSFSTGLLKQVNYAKKNNTKLSDEAVYEYLVAVKKLTPETREIYLNRLSESVRKQHQDTNLNKLKMYLDGLKKIDEFKALRQKEKEIELAELNRIKTNKEVFFSTNKRFAPETFAFFVASGAVTFNMMWIKSHGDPLELERHIMSLKDPIAHISFYAFMQANGFFINFHTSKNSFQALDDSTKRQMMVKLSYAGMAVGSLASSIVSDVGQSIVSCSKKWLQGKKDDESLQSCDMAMKQWTVRKKTNQYFPQIISLFASQAVTELVENSAYRAFERMAVKSFAEKYLTRRALLSMAYRITAADVVLTCIPYAGEAKWITKGLKFVGTVTKLGAFVAIDHIISRYINRPINNLLKPSLFDNKNVPNMNEAWLAADSINWDDKKAATTSRKKSLDEKIMPHVKTGALGSVIVKFGEDVNNLKETFPADIESYTEEMQVWRTHLNETADNDLASWEEMTKKVLNQIDFSYQFYRQFTDELYTLMNTRNEVAKGALAPSALAGISQYPLKRVLPFYGVKPVKLLKESALKFNDKYLTDPNVVEKLQRENISNVVTKYLAQNRKFDGRNEENRIYSEILSKLNSAKTATIVSGLVQLRKVYNDVTAMNTPVYSGSGNVPVSSYKGPYYDVVFQGVIRLLFADIGNPTPIMDPLASFTQAIASHTVFKGMDSLADYSEWSLRKKYQFNKVTDLMMYKMICGDQKASLNQIKKAGVYILTPEFNPPSLLKPNDDRKHFCETLTNSQNLYYGKIDNEAVSSYLYKNFNFAAMGDYTKVQDKNIFEKWWINAAKKPMEKEFKSFDKLYKEAYEQAYDNFVGNGTWYEKLTDTLHARTEYLPDSLKASFKTENNVYLQLINRALIEKTVTVRSANPDQKIKAGNFVAGLLMGPSLAVFSGAKMPSKTTDYLLQANDKTKYAQFNPIHSMQRPEVMKLYALLNESLTFVENYKKTAAQNGKGYRAKRFNEYIENSKKIDKAINDILVSAGLKKLVKKADAKLTEDQLAEMAFAGLLEATASGTECTEDVYEDLKVANPTFRQKVIISAVRGIRQVESDTRRFIRMNTLLSNRLYVESQEVLTQIGSN